MSLVTHRAKEELGGVVYLLTIDMTGITNDPTHVLRIVNNYGEDGTGVQYQGVTYEPHPYQIQKVSRSAKTNPEGSVVSISDIEDHKITRFIDKVGGSLQDARVLEYKVYGVFLDNGDSPNSLAFSKRLDHVVDYIKDTGIVGELKIHTVDPLSKAIEVPTKTFTAGLPNGTVSAINIFPAADRTIVEN